MTVQAYQKIVRHTPRKLRLVADMIRNLPLEEALTQLQFASQLGAEPIRKVLTQAKANAINAQLRPDSLKIKSCIIEEGPTLKRWQPVSRGRAHPILKRTSHIRIVVEGTEQTAPPKSTKK